MVLWPYLVPYLIRNKGFVTFDEITLNQGFFVDLVQGNEDPYYTDGISNESSTMLSNVLIYVFNMQYFSFVILNI